MIGGPISGEMFNPAVSVMMAAAGKLSSKDLLPYVLAQVAGGLAALELSAALNFNSLYNFFLNYIIQCQNQDIIVKVVLEPKERRRGGFTSAVSPSLSQVQSQMPPPMKPVARQVSAPAP